MICPRCGVVNAPERTSCTRCSGSLAPPAQRDDRPLPPVMPITKRAELKLGRAASPAQAGKATVANGPAAQGPPNQARPGSEPSEAPALDLYLLSAERSTGQPAPPEASVNHSERLSTDRSARLAVGFSRA